jgi:hypothetical protein
LNFDGINDGINDGIDDGIDDDGETKEIMTHAKVKSSSPNIEIQYERKASAHSGTNYIVQFRTSYTIRLVE